MTRPLLMMCVLAHCCGMLAPPTNAAYNAMLSRARSQSPRLRRRRTPCPRTNHSLAAPGGWLETNFIRPTTTTNGECRRGTMADNLSSWYSNSAQAGLSWSTVLNKREGYRKAFAQFDPAKVARFTPKRIERLIADPGIIRNRLKITAAVHNARLFLKVQEEFGTFCDYIWQFVDGSPIQNRWQKQADVPASTPASDALSKDLKQRGFKFVGTTIVYAHMQAVGMINDHIVSCYRHKQCAVLA